SCNRTPIMQHPMFYPPRMFQQFPTMQQPVVNMPEIKKSLSNVNVTTVTKSDDKILPQTKSVESVLEKSDEKNILPCDRRIANADMPPGSSLWRWICEA